MRRTVGIALFVVGIILVIFGISASESLGSSIKEFFTGTPTDKAVWFLIGGAAAIVVGGFLSFGPGRDTA